jgi:heterodisulfide reductase subunit B2
MKFAYYPGCSVKSTGMAYEQSLIEVCKVLGIELQEIEDWNCCGATAYMSVDDSMSFALAARNLALAEKQQHDMLAPCAACYLVMEKTQRYMREHHEIREKVERGLGAAGLSYSGHTAVRHPLDVIVNDIGLDAVKAKVTRPLKGLKVAPYYGCQVVRPYSTFDHPMYPVLMDKLLQAAGATVVPYPLKTRCCGGSLTGTVKEVGVRMSWVLIREAKKRGADVITTLCPLCNFNLDSYQDESVIPSGERVHVPTTYFTQLLGLALGIPESRLGFNRHIVSVQPALDALARGAQAAPAKAGAVPAGRS